MKTLNHKLIIKICNLACIVLTAILIILQFIPFLYNVDGNVLTRTEYVQLCEGKEVTPRLHNIEESTTGTSKIVKIDIHEFEAPIESITTRTSIASVVWLGPFLNMQNHHIPILLFGLISIIISIINRHSTLHGLLYWVSAYFGVLQTIYLGTILSINIIISILIALFALPLCVYHIGKIWTWFTVKDDKYRSMWGPR